MLATMLAFSLAQGPALIPLPNKLLQTGNGSARLTQSSLIKAPAGMFAVTELKTALKGVSGKGDYVRFNLDKSLGKEAYSLDAAKGGVHINYGGPSGALYAVQTLKQLMNHGTVPSVAIDDSPRFAWRGFHLDVSRHFFPVEVVKRQLDLMKTYKFNVFHWHLVDDGGWRIEIKKYPKLTQLGAYRKGNGDWGQNGIELVPKGPNTYGGFYTQEQVKDVVKYASDRGITVVPEIEMPGHTLPMIIAYPEVGCTNAKPYPAVKWVTNVYCAGKEKTFEMISNILDEVLALFPSKDIHIGGDEVDSKWWEECPDCQARLKSEGLKGSDELQSYFIRRIEKMLNAKGRNLMGWDEILAGGLAPNAQVMSWRGVDGGIAAAKAGHPVVMTPGSHCYFDSGYDSIDTKKVYMWEPVPEVLNKEEGKMIRGGQANLWTEWVPTRDKIDTQMWPRALAMSETLWSTRSKNWENFQARLLATYPKLDAMGVAYRLEAPASAMYFANDAPTYKADPRQPALYASTDPKAPSSKWTKVTTMTLPRNKPVYVAYRRGSGSVGDPGRLFWSDAMVSQSAGMPANGLKVDTWTGEFKSVKDFENDRPSGHAAADVVSTACGPRKNVIGLRFHGRVGFPDTKFKLFLTSDDGSVLRLNGVTVIDNDGPHAPATKEVALQAERGLYDLDLSFFDSGGGVVLKFEYEGPDGVRREVPAEWLYQPK